MNDDLIKRSDAIKVVWECYRKCYKRVVEGDIPQNVVDLAMVDAMQTTLSAIPSADRPQGEWIEGGVGHSPGYTCSICGYGVQPWNNTNYCPNCGAKMKGADNA